MNFNVEKDKQFIDSLIQNIGYKMHGFQPVQLSQRELALNIKPGKFLFFGELTVNSDGMSNVVSYVNWYTSALVTLAQKPRFQYQYNRFNQPSIILFDDIYLSTDMLNTVGDIFAFFIANPSLFRQLSNVDANRPFPFFSFIGYKINVGGQ